MLGNGMIWFNKSQNGWNILSMNGVAEERVDQSSVGWSIGQQVVHPFCFNRPWMSGDNFEEFSEVFGIDDLNQFLQTPGRFIGNPISNFAPIKPSWCSSDSRCETITLVSQINQCQVETFEFETKEGNILIRVRWVNIMNKRL